jgi:hypothetical protein
VLPQALNLLLVPGCFVLLVPAEDPGDLQPSAECLVEQHPRLELGHKGEPREERDGREQQEPHQDLVATCEGLHRSPQPGHLHRGFDRLGNLTKTAKSRPRQEKTRACEGRAE